MRRRRMNQKPDEEVVDFSGEQEGGIKKNRFSFARTRSEKSTTSNDKKEDTKKKNKWSMPKMPSKNSVTMMMMKNGGAGAMAKMAMKS